MPSDIMTRLLDRRGFLYLGSAAALAGLSGCADDGGNWPTASGPKVVVSFAPLLSIAKNVLGERGAIKTILSSSGPHGADIKLTEAVVLRKANLFFINGLGLETKSANKLVLASGNKSLKLVDLGSMIPTKELLEGGCDHDHAAGEVHDHDHGDDTDPHVWMGLDHAMNFAETMAKELALVDPDETAGYRARSEGYRGKLAALKVEGKALLKDKKERKFLPLHGSMQYFAKTFDLVMLDPIQATPGKEPTPKKLEQLVELCRMSGTRVIAVEPQFSGQSSAKRIVDELKRRGVADVVVVELDPLETGRIEDIDAAWYETKMRANITALAAVLR